MPYQTVSVRVEISNYVKEDTYQINLYKEGSAVPMDTIALAANSIPIVYFKDKPGDQNYDGEVLHFCPGGGYEVLRKKIYDAATPGCKCADTWTPNADNSMCVRITTIAPVVVGPVYNVGNGPKEMNYCREGIRVYAPGFLPNGQGSSAYDSGSGHVYWAAGGTLTKGRLNVAGVWNAADPNLPLVTWIGFSKKISIPSAKTYYVGMAGDNAIRFKVNGVIAIDQSLFNPNATANFIYWHTYPIYLNAGDNIIEMEVYNTNLQGCFAAEIYDCDLIALQNATLLTENTLGRIFSTLDMVGGVFTNKFVCQDGFALDISNPSIPMCKKIEYTSCQ